ncbi:membrane integrity-associated transporter subunit PqiC [Rhizobium sp. KVB221]|uniref:Membrane integrity-associated transporter subunit PqiC n=2 Tax=Rhizobium setariae TaxID=2801340 RepID=A0A937CL32_9HYPH|nr:ABC-type transport auxiliary lipoprotein family protein [Rhizobium setariae]MBL0372755.1 membrane integrity-associated transporter subunit PqiC [Rhizobium setariae]
MGSNKVWRGARAIGLGVLLAAGLSGCAGGARDDTFSLSSVPEVVGPTAKNRQILVPEPTALKALDSEQVVIRLSGSEIQYLSKSRWSDRLPRLVQSKLIEAFENTGKLGGVGRPGEGLAIDYQVVADIRSFEIDAGGNDRASIEISVKILNDRNGAVKSQRVFSTSAPVVGSGNAAFIAALDKAFSQATGEIVSWALNSI